MASGGHNRKSTAKHHAEGTYNATKHGKAVIDVPPITAIPNAPGDFDAEHAAKWREVCDLIFGAGILAKQDLHSIRTYVETSIMQRNAWREVVAGGSVDDEKGKASAAFLIYERCDKILKPLREQFGFTPRSRQSINLAPVDEIEDSIAAIYNAN